MHDRNLIQGEKYMNCRKSLTRIRYMIIKVIFYQINQNCSFTTQKQTLASYSFNNSSIGVSISGNDHKAKLLRNASSVMDIRKSHP